MQADAYQHESHWNYQFPYAHYDWWEYRRHWWDNGVHWHEHFNATYNQFLIKD